MKVQDITNTIIEALEKGVVPWRYPMRPHAGWSGHRYRGINALSTQIMATEMGYKSTTWLTDKALNKSGGWLLDDEAPSALIVYWDRKFIKEKDEEEESKTKTYMSPKIYKVYNLDECVGYEKKEVPVTGDAVEGADKVITNYLSREEITRTQVPGKAYYSPRGDEINCPLPDNFLTMESYYSTMFHEMGHSTGATGRIGRDIANIFGDHAYSKEELIAEMTSSFLMGHCEIEDPTELEQSASYIAGWLKAFDNKKDLVMKAAQEAQKAYDYITLGGVKKGGDHV